MNYWQFKFKEQDWCDWNEVIIGHIEDWRYPRLKKDRDIAINDIVFLYRTDDKKNRGIYFIAKVISIDLDRHNPIDLEIIKDLKSSIFKPEEFNFENLMKKINKLGQNGTYYKLENKDNPQELYALVTNYEIDISIPEELNKEDIDNLTEGSKKQITVNSYERNSKARKECIEKYGYSCSVCDFNFKDIYGNLGENFIHVHHLIPLSKIKEEYKINPIKDLKPVCPNCHAMLHRKKETLSIKELKKIIS